MTISLHVLKWAASLTGRHFIRHSLTPDEKLREIGEVADLRLCLTEPLFIIVALAAGPATDREGRRPACSKERMGTQGSRQACGLIGKFERPIARLKDFVAGQQKNDH